MNKILYCISICAVCLLLSSHAKGQFGSSSFPFTGPTSTNSVIIAGNYGTDIYSTSPYTDTEIYNEGYGWDANLNAPGPEIWYKFTVPGSGGNISLSNCGSDIDTFIYLFDQDGNLIASNDDNGPLCAGTSGSLTQYLNAGTYYVLSEAVSYNDIGHIVTSISSDIPLPPPPPQGWSSDAPISAGFFGTCTSSGTFTDTENNNPANGFQNKAYEPSDDIYYDFSVTGTTTMNISTCGSNFNTYLHLLKETSPGNYTLIAANDDNGPLCAGSKASISMQLDKGHYMVIAEGSGSSYGDLNISISAVPPASLPPGSSLANAINAGTLTSSYSFTSAPYVPSDCYPGTAYDGYMCFYRFSLSSTSKLNISTCGSASNATILNLLNKNGGVFLTANMYGPVCSGNQASIKTELPAGDYYVATIGFNLDESITTTMSLDAPGTTSGIDFTGLNFTCTPLASVPSIDQNYIMTSTPRVPLTAIDPNATYTVCDINQTVAYFDGLGRPIQTISVNASPDATKDVVQPIAYDQYGRESIKYLPYTTANGSRGSYQTRALADIKGAYTGSEQYNFYNKSGQNYTMITSPYAATAFEASPENRPIEQGAPGDIWQLTGVATVSGNNGHTVKIVYTVNDGTSYTAKRYAVAGDAGTPTLLDKGVYDAGSLYVTVTKDENWKSDQTDARLNTTEEYRDKNGLVILKRTYNSNSNTTPATFETLSTYYVYNDAGNLSFVLPPKAEADGGISSATNQAVIDNLCYQYIYDEINRLVKKRIPGADWQYMVYNPHDQLVATQDGNQRLRREWTITKYDNLGRAILTGLWNNNNIDISPENLRNQIDGQTGTYEVKDKNQTYGYSLNNTYPTSLNGVLTVNYYDDYNFPGSNPYPYVDNTQIVDMPATSSQMTQGLLTGTRTAVLNTITNATPDMLWTVNYYDDKGRVIQTDAQHYLGGTLSASNYDQISNGYDFSNEVLQTIRKHYNSASSNPAVTVSNNYVYDHVGRKRQTWEQINNSDKVLLSQVDYNEVGQLYKKKLQGDNGPDASPAGTDIALGAADAVISGQKSVVASHSITLSPGFYTGAGVTFSASIERQFLQTVIYSYNERGWLRTANTSGNLFNLDLRYDTPDVGSVPQYNGNISQLGYNVTKVSNPGSRQFNYTYDALNRLVNASSTSSQLDETIGYDKMGNIVHLNRSGNSAASLDYNYNDANGNYSNQLTAVKNNSSDFRSYTYDANGNAKSDGGSKTINYNLLNLPESVTSNGSTLATYTYGAFGAKLRNTGSDGPWDYINGIVYQNNAISFIQTEEGRATKNTSDNTYHYEYNLKDHLGNTRISFDAGTNGAARIIQEDEYYSFGLRKTGGYDLSNNNRYLYNGKEIQTDLANEYDYGARFYDPVIGRWTSVDPLSEKHTGITPYNYVLNNPMTYGDEFGMDTTKVIRLKEITIKGLVSNQKSGQPFNWFGLDYKKIQRDAPNEPNQQGMKFVAINLPLIAIPWGRFVKLSAEALGLISVGEKLLPIVEALGEQKLVKIMAETHAWAKVAVGGEAEVRAIMSKVLQEGVEMPYGNTLMGSSSKILQYNGEIVQVVTNNVGGRTVVSNAWVITDPAYKFQALKILSSIK